MIPNIVRGSDPAGLVRYLFGKGRRNEHTDQHLVCASGDMFPSFDMDGKPAASYAEIGRRFDRRYRVRERKDDPFPPDMRGKNNPEREHGRKRVWHCSLAIKAGQGILTDQEWEAVIRNYLTRMNIIDGDDDQGVTWLAVRHGLSANGNDHVHIMVQLAADDGWINPYHDRINAQKSCRRMVRWAILASCSLCVTMTMVVPSWFSSVSRCITSAPFLESRLPVGSSARMSFGPKTTARAMATRCC